MATKQINQLISATAIEDTDSIPIQTLAGLTKKFTPAILKANLDGRYQQLGTVIWEDEAGDISVSLGVSTNFLNHRLLIYVPIDYDVTSEIAEGRQILDIIYTASNVYGCFTCWDNWATTPEAVFLQYRLYFSSGNLIFEMVNGENIIYKIIDMGVAQ